MELSFINEEELINIVKDNYENNIKIMEFMHKMDKREKDLYDKISVSESVDYSKITAFQEASVETVKNAIINAITKFKNKIIELWQKYITKITSFVSEKYTKYVSPKVNKVLNSKYVDTILKKLKIRKVNANSPIFDASGVMNKAEAVVNSGDAKTAKEAADKVFEGKDATTFVKEKTDGGEATKGSDVDIKLPYKIIKALKENLKKIKDACERNITKIKKYAVDKAGELSAKARNITIINTIYTQISNAIFKVSQSEIVSSIKTFFHIGKQAKNVKSGEAEANAL